MNLYYNTDRLIMKTELPEASRKVLAFYKKNSPYFDAWEITRPYNFYTESFHSASLSYEYKETSERRAVRLWIYNKEEYLQNSFDAPIIGSISISHIHLGAFKTGVLGYKLDHDYWGQGYATEACEKMISLAFHEYDLHRLESYIMPSNERSINLIRRLGFTLAGTKVSYVEINHRYEDHLQYALINPAAARI